MTSTRLFVVVALAMATLPLQPATAAEDFVDDDGSVHEESIERIAALGITLGCNPPTNDKFCPDRSVTRGEFAAFLARSLDVPTASQHSFTDIGGSVFVEDIASLAAAGITKGCDPPDNTKFCPNRRLNRGELAALLARALSLSVTGNDYFADDDGDVFEADINRLAAAGITKGCDDELYCPERSLSRAEMASFLVRMLDGGGEPPPVRTGEPPGDGGTSAPKDAVVIRPSDNAQQIVNSKPAGTAFLLKAGTHREFSVVPKNGNSFYGESGTVVSGARALTAFDKVNGGWAAKGQTQQAPTNGQCESGNACQYAEGVWVDGRELTQVTSQGALGPGKFYFDYGANIIYIGDNPGGHLVETSVSQAAFSGSADDVSVIGIVIEKYATPAQSGTISPEMHANTGDRWAVRESEIRFVHGAGLKLGNQMTVDNSYIHHNGWMGIHGSSGFRDARVIDSELAHNCLGGFKCFGWGGGGLKAGQGTGLLIRGTESHHNLGKGLHVDNGMKDAEIRSNHVHHNDGAGIMVELSSDVSIHGNLVEDNGFDQTNGAPGPGIGVLSSHSVEIRSNTVRWNGHGIVVRRTTRGPVDDITVASNNVAMQSGVTGVYDDTGNGVYTQDIRFSGNTYNLGSKTKYYYWNGSQVTAAQWKKYGNDVDGKWE